MSVLSRRAFLLAAILLSLAHGASFAQPSSLAVSVSAGFIPSPADVSWEHPDRLFYPEVQVESQFAAFADKTLSAHGAVYYGYWHDGSGAPFEYIYGGAYIARAASEHIVGGRLLIVGEEGFLPVMVSLGLARHFAFIDYVGGNAWSVPEPDARSAYTTAEVGLHVRIPVVGGLEVQGGARRFVRLPVDGHLIEAFVEGRRAYQVGLTYTLLRR